MIWITFLKVLVSSEVHLSKVLTLTESFESKSTVKIVVGHIYFMRFELQNVWNVLFMYFRLLRPVVYWLTDWLYPDTKIYYFHVMTFEVLRLLWRIFVFLHSIISNINAPDCEIWVAAHSLRKAISKCSAKLLPILIKLSPCCWNDVPPLNTPQFGPLVWTTGHQPHNLIELAVSLVKDLCH